MNHRLPTPGFASRTAALIAGCGLIAGLMSPALLNAQGTRGASSINEVFAANDDYQAARRTLLSLRHDAANGTGAPQLGLDPGYPRSLPAWQAIRQRSPPAVAPLDPCANALIQATDEIIRVAPQMRGHGQDPTGINAGTRRARALIAQADQCMAKADQTNSTRLQGGVAASRTPDPSGGEQHPGGQRPGGQRPGAGLSGGVSGGGMSGTGQVPEPAVPDVPGQPRRPGPHAIIRGYPVPPGFLQPYPPNYVCYDRKGYPYTRLENVEIEGNFLSANGAPRIPPERIGYDECINPRPVHGCPPMGVRDTYEVIRSSDACYPPLEMRTPRPAPRPQEPDCPGALEPEQKAELRAGAQEVLRTFAQMGSQVDTFQETLGRLVAARLVTLSEPNYYHNKIHGYLSKNAAINHSLQSGAEAVANYLSNRSTQAQVHLRLWNDAKKALEFAAKQPAVALAVLAEQGFEDSLGAAGFSACNRIAGSVDVRAAISKARAAAQQLKQRAATGNAHKLPDLTGACSPFNPGNGEYNCVPSSVALDQAIETGKPFTEKDFNFLGGDVPHYEEDVRRLLSGIYGNRTFPGHSAERMRAQSEGARTLMTRVEMERELMQAGHGARGLVTVAIPDHLRKPGQPPISHMYSVFYNSSNGQIRYADAQSGEVNAYRLFVRIGGEVSNQQVRFYRTN